MPDAKHHVGNDLHTSLILEERVLAELLAARKTQHGLTEGLMARSPTLTSLLSDGDPKAALRALMSAVLEHIADTDDPMAVLAATYSLGLAEEQTHRLNTHLARLVEFGEQYGFEQRQARRYSDQGLREITRLVVSLWAMNAQPRLNIILVTLPLQPEDEDVFKIALVIDQQTKASAPMRPPVLGIQIDDQPRAEPTLAFVDTSDHTDAEPGWISSSVAEPIRLTFHTRLYLVVRWGPLWPSFTFMATDQMPCGLDTSIEAKGRTFSIAMRRR